MGVSKVEAYGTGASKGKHQLYHQILGRDEPGENWADHRDPQTSLALLLKKIECAWAEAVTLRYKMWLDSAGPL